MKETLYLLHVIAKVWLLMVETNFNALNFCAAGKPRFSHARQLVLKKHQKNSGICYPACGMVHIKDSLLLTGKSSPCRGGSGSLLSLSEWSFTMCPTSYDCK